MSSVTYKCPNCGGPLSFKPDLQKLKCDYCLSEYTEQEARDFAGKHAKDALSESDASAHADASSIQPASDPLSTTSAEAGSTEQAFEQQARLYLCDSCGAEIVTDETTAATFCYYCHNPTILPRQLSGTFRPQKVIPFQFNREEATRSFVKWCRRKPLLSTIFTSHSELEKLSGIYVPFWLHDCEVQGSLMAKGKKVRSWSKGGYHYTETKHYQIARTGTARYSGVPADGSKKMDDAMMKVLEPYDYKELTDFSMAYLSGYLAEKYDVGKDEVFPGVSQRVQDDTDTLLRDTIQGYSHVHTEQSHMEMEQVTCTYVLLPVWMFTYQFKGKTYMFAMNGQTGKIAGSLPISWKRAAAWFGIVTGVSFAALSTGGAFLW
ncbi:hypothetical protein [Marinicrinis sediminis]|uniref:TFIIB-type zinc ribbon-containing protein n=1 Tax=Marinicrinis sediminis TaxID=1652465 RepID=A0ABW5RDJ7_9BACL